LYGRSKYVFDGKASSPTKQKCIEISVPRKLLGEGKSTCPFSRSIAKDDLLHTTPSLIDPENYYIVIVLNIFKYNTKIKREQVSIYRIGQYQPM